jgi:hypothetical protein
MNKMPDIKRAKRHRKEKRKSNLHKVRVGNAIHAMVKEAAARHRMSQQNIYDKGAEMMLAVLRHAPVTTSPPCE